MYVLSIHKACKGLNTSQCVFCVDSYGVPKKKKQTILLCICAKSIWWNCVQKTNQKVYVAQQKNDAVSFNKKGKGKFHLISENLYDLQ